MSTYNLIPTTYDRACTFV